MKHVNVHQAKTHLSKLLQRVAAGEELVIANRGVPVARLLPVTVRRPHRELGTERGKLKVSGDFDAPLPPELLAQFYGESLKRKRR